MFNIELQNLSFAYDGGRPIIDDVNLRLRAGEVTVVRAEVGSGKSTLLKLCAGILRPTGGELIIDGKLFWHLSVNEQNYLRSCMGFDFQEAALISNMSIFNNLALPLRYHEELDEKGIKSKINQWLDKLGLKAYRDLLPAALSVGLRRRVSFIRAMLSGSNFFFWDDPTEGRTQEFETIIMETIINKKKEGTGSLATSQDQKFIEKMADKILSFADGKIYSG
jgi:phospholipid/cholesterol/gamma-HCH transport system ATP-binding protein